MKTVDASELLQIWGRGAGFAPALALLPLLRAACPDIPPERLLQLTIGERDGLLLTQREWMFGPQIEAIAVCPECGERLELSLTVDNIRAVPAIIGSSSLGQNFSLTAVVDGYQVEFHAPTIADIRNGTSLEQLLECCVVNASRTGKALAAGELPRSVIDAISQEMAAADPQADIQLALDCPACEHKWPAAFDIASFFWEEIQSWAQRTLLEIHHIASVYGWSEEKILALSPQRRQIYLTMIGAS